MPLQIRYIVPAALAVAGVLLSPLLMADEAAPLGQAGALRQTGSPGQVGPIAAAPPVPATQPAATGAAPVCMTDWSEAGPIVRREGLATMERVGRLAREKAALEIVTSALCKTDEGYTYRLRVRGGLDGGKAMLRTLYVDARKPFGPQ